MRRPLFPGRGYLPLPSQRVAARERRRQTLFLAEMSMIAIALSAGATIGGMILWH